MGVCPYGGVFGLRAIWAASVSGPRPMSGLGLAGKKFLNIDTIWIFFSCDFDLCDLIWLCKI